MNLSERLYAASKLLGRAETAADVGCDHAHLAIYLIEEKKAGRVYAMDINPGPLERARANAISCGVEEEMEFILSDGLKAMPEPYADAVVIMGMGGALISQIIREAPEEIRKAVRRFVLGPQSELDLFRKDMEAEGLVITAESHVFEDGKYYTLMAAEPERLVMDSGRYVLRAPCEYIYGRSGLERRDKVLKGRIKKDLATLNSILAGELPPSRRNELSRRRDAALAALKRYEEVDL